MIYLKAIGYRTELLQKPLNPTTQQNFGGGGRVCLPELLVHWLGIVKLLLMPLHTITYQSILSLTSLQWSLSCRIQDKRCILYCQSCPHRNPQGMVCTWEIFLSLLGHCTVESVLWCSGRSHVHSPLESGINNN